MWDPAEKGLQQHDAASSQWGQSLCWICQQVTAAWHQQAENCLEYLILPVSSRHFCMSETELVYDMII